jgi:AraC-like DNA-binding protein
MLIAFHKPLCTACSLISSPQFWAGSCRAWTFQCPTTSRRARFNDLCIAFSAEIRQDAPERHTALYALALTLAVRLSRQVRCLASGKPSWIDAAVKLIRTRFAEDLRLAALSDEIGVAPSTLATAFRRHLHQSVGEFLLEIRLQHARSAILGSSEALSRIAVSCGFYDQAHLTRSFRRQYGITPARLRGRPGRVVQA